MHLLYMINDLPPGNTGLSCKSFKNELSRYFNCQIFWGIHYYSVPFSRTFTQRKFDINKKLVHYVGWVEREPTKTQTQKIAFKLIYKPVTIK